MLKIGSQQQVVSGALLVSPVGFMRAPAPYFICEFELYYNFKLMSPWGKYTLIDWLMKFFFSWFCLSLNAENRVKYLEWGD